MAQPNSSPDAPSVVPSRRSIAARLRWLRRAWLLDATLRSVAFLAAIGALLSATSFLLDWWLDVPLAARRLLTSVGVIAWIAVAFREILGTWRRRPSLEAFAKRVEERWPSARGLLVSAYEWRAAPSGNVAASPLWRGVSIELIAEVRRQAEEATRESNFRRLFPELSNGRMLALGLTHCIAAVGVGGVVSGTESGRVWLARNWRFEAVDYPRRTELSVENLVGGELVVPRGGVA